MTISTPLTSRAKKHTVVIQCVTRTTTVCRGVFVVVGTAEARLGTQAASAIPVWYQFASAHLEHVRRGVMVPAAADAMPYTYTPAFIGQLTSRRASTVGVTNEPSRPNQGYLRPTLERHSRLLHQLTVLRKGTVGGE